MKVEEIKENENRLTKLEDSMEHLEETFEENKNSVNQRFDQVEEHIQSMDTKVTEIMSVVKQLHSSNKVVINAIEKHTDSDRHSRIVWTGIWRGIWGTSLLRKIIIIVFILGLLVIFFPIQELADKIELVEQILGIRL